MWPTALSIRACVRERYERRRPAARALAGVARPGRPVDDFALPDPARRLDRPGARAARSARAEHGAPAGAAIARVLAGHGPTRPGPVQPAAARGANLGRGRV